MKNVWILIVFISSTLAGQNTEAELFKTKLINCKTDTCKILNLYQIGRSYLSSNLDSAQIYCNRSIELSEDLNYSISAYKGRLLLGTIYQKNRHFEKCDSVYTLLKKEKIEDKNLKMFFYAGLGTYYQRRGFIDSSLVYNYKSLDLIEGDSTMLEQQTSLRLSIARMHKSKFEYQKALSILYQIEERLEIENRLTNNRALRICIDKAMIYKSMNDYSSAVNLLELAIIQFEDKNIGYDYYKLFSNLGNLYMLQNDMIKLKSVLDFLEKAKSELSKSTMRSFLDLKVDYHTQIGDFDLASKENEVFKEFLLANNFAKRLYLYYNNRGKILQSLNMENLANEAFSKSLREIGTERKYSNIYKDILEGYLQTAPKINNTYKKRLESYIDIRDSLTKDIVEEEVLKSREEYQTEKVNSENIFLKQENELKEQNIKLQRNGLIVLVLGVIGVLTLLLRLKRQNNRILTINSELDSKNAKIKLFSRETIHRTKNQIALIANLITNQKRLIGELSPSELIEDIDSKVRALAEVNRSLDINEEDFSVGIIPIFQSILENNTYSLAEKKIDVKIEGDDVKIDGNKISNIALVINELSTNSIKYAFHEVDIPKINVNTSYQQNDIIIEYKDNGKTTVNQLQRNGKGTKLIQGIVQYMGGSITNHITDNGYASTIKLPRYEK